MIIRNRSQLALALSKYARLQARIVKVSTLKEAVNRAILAYYEKHHLPRAQDEDGVYWRQQQGSTAIYDEKAFRKLLDKKGIDTETVYKSRVVIERDDEVIMQLLKEKRISVEEWKKVVAIRYSKPYLRKQPTRSDKGGGKRTDTDSGVPIRKTGRDVRDGTKAGGKPKKSL